MVKMRHLSKYVFGSGRELLVVIISVCLSVGVSIDFYLNTLFKSDLYQTLNGRSIGGHIALYLK